MRVLRLADVTPVPQEAPLLSVTGVSKRFGAQVACRDVSFDLWPGEVLGVVGESGSGKTTLLNCVSAQLRPDRGRIEYRLRDGEVADLFELSEPVRRRLMRTDWGFVHPNPRDGLGTTHHESGTLRMGEDPATSVTTPNGRFQRVSNAYAIGPSLLLGLFFAAQAGLNVSGMRRLANEESSHTA